MTPSTPPMQPILRIHGDPGDIDAADWNRLLAAEAARVDGLEAAREREREAANRARLAEPSAPRRRPASPRLTERRRARLAEPSAARERRGGGASPGREERREEGRREECRAGERDLCGAREEG